MLKAAMSYQKKRQSRKELLVDLNTRLQRQKTSDAILLFLSAVDCPRALTCWLLFNNNEHDQLATLEYNPTDYNGHEKTRDSLLATSFLSKFKHLNTTFDTKQRAIDKFKMYESQCGLTNSRIILDLDNISARNIRILTYTKSIINSILTSFSHEEFVDCASWGPGATTLMKSAEASATNKFHEERGITPRALRFIEPWFDLAYPSWAQHIRQSGGWVVVPGNKIISVPKNSSIDRIIAVEPGINLWFQKSIGTMIRRRLARAGLDLSTQENNQVLCRESSISDSHATIDFSSASDSIAYRTVEYLLPTRWFSLLANFRSQTGQLDGNADIFWRKFSSMGNGYTFELESLIFFALAKACTILDGDEESKTIEPICVYGDDVILPKNAVRSYVECCTFLGFTVNTKKSFFSGYFRESCGAFSYSGRDIKPIYLKDRLHNVEALYKLANSIRRLSHRRNCNYGCDISFKHCWLSLYSLCPKSVRFQISEGFGDIGFIDNFDIVAPAVRRSKLGHEGFIAQCLKLTPSHRVHDGFGLLLDRVTSVKGPLDFSDIRHLKGTQPSDLSPGNQVVSKSSVIRGVTNITIPSWYNLGPWI